MFVDYMTANTINRDRDTEMRKRLRKSAKIHLGHGVYKRHGVHIGDMCRWREHWASCLDLGIITHSLTCR